MGTLAHRRPSASFSTAASTPAIRGLVPTAIQPARQPGARYDFERLPNEITGASGSIRPIGGVGSP